MYGESASAYAELCEGALELAGEVRAIVVGDAAAAASVPELGVAVRHVPYDGTGLLDDCWPVVCDEVAGLDAELVLVGLLAVKLGAAVASDASGLSVTEDGRASQGSAYSTCATSE